MIKINPCPPGRTVDREEGEEMYVYIKSEPGLWTVGFYDPSNKWHPESDYEDQTKAAERVHYLNGGK